MKISIKRGEIKLEPETESETDQLVRVERDLQLTGSTHKSTHQWKLIDITIQTQLDE